MSEESLHYTISEDMSNGNLTVNIPVDVNVKGLQTFTIDLDEVELAETGTKDKNNKPTQYMTFKFTKLKGK